MCSYKNIFCHSTALGGSLTFFGIYSSSLFPRNTYMKTGMETWVFCVLIPTVDI